MQIQNKALANVTLRCVSGENVTGDALGVFEMSDDDAEAIVNTPGWAVYRKPEPVKPLRVRIQEEAEAEMRQARLEDEQRRDAEAAAELEAERIEQERLEAERALLAKPSSPPPGLPAMPPPPPTLVGGVPVSVGPAVDATDDAEETEEIDLDVLSKDQLLELAEKYKVTVDKRWGETRLREELAKAIFVTEGG